MIKILVSFLVFVISQTLVAQPKGQNPDFNPGFERIHNGSPEGWFEWGSGYKVQPDSTVRYSGKFSMRLEPFDDKHRNFGSIVTSIPAQYNAREIEVSARMKLNNVAGGPIGLLIRIDGTSDILSFDNMQSKNVQGTMDWTSFSVKVAYPPDAVTIYVGALLSGSGQLWVDDFQVTLDGKDIRDAERIKPVTYKADEDHEFNKGSGITSIALTKSKTADLEILGRVWGFLKYYHPAVAKGDHNWDYELFRVLPKVLATKNIAQRNQVLYDWVNSLGDLEVSTTTKDSIQQPKLAPDFQWIKESNLGKPLTLLLQRVKSAQRAKEHYYVGQVPRVGNPTFARERPYSTMRFPDVGFRVLSLYRYWNIINYFFPYRHLMDKPWNDMLGEYLPVFINASDELKYKLASLSLIARVQDTHANIWGGDPALNQYHGHRYAPVEISFVEKKAIVTGYLDEERGLKSGLKIGDVIEKVDGKEVSEIVKQRLPLTPASNYPTQLRDIAPNLLRSNNSSIEVVCDDGKEKMSKRIPTYTTNEVKIYSRFHRKDTCFRFVQPDIGYLYLGTIKNSYLQTLVRETEKMKGLIIDLRCYPSEFVVFTIGSFLVPAKTPFVRFSVGSITEPGVFTLTEALQVGKPNPDYFKGKVVILVNEKTQSQAEYTAMAFRTAPRCTVIGSTTAGADGNVSEIILPGAIATMISGIGVYYPDGRETQRVGIVPDIEVKPTIEGVRSGRDELLEKAIEIINAP